MGGLLTSDVLDDDVAALLEPRREEFLGDVGAVLDLADGAERAAPVLGHDGPRLGVERTDDSALDVAVRAEAPGLVEDGRVRLVRAQVLLGEGRVADLGGATPASLADVHLRHQTYSRPCRSTTASG